VDAADLWVQEHVEPAGPRELVKERPWATTWRIPIAGDAVFLKRCADVQAFEPRLTASLHGRWPDRVAEVIACDERRRWLLLRDAGTPIEAFGDQLDAWLIVLPLYAELQIGETTHAAEHLAGGVPDRRLEVLPELYGELAHGELPLDADEVDRLRAFAPRFAAACADLAAADLAPSIQHDDLHHLNVFARDGVLRVLDWGDSSVAHPFFSLVTTFRHIERVNALVPDDPWFARARSAYLEPWGPGLDRTLRDAIFAGEFAYAIAAYRLRNYLDDAERAEFDPWFAQLLRRALAQAAPAGETRPVGDTTKETGVSAASIDDLKRVHRATWAAGDYAAVADAITAPVAQVIVERARVEAGQSVVDVATGSGNVALVAAGRGAHVVGLDLTPELFATARSRAAALGVEVDWLEGDAEALPFADAIFDRVLSAFGVMFAPRHREAASELVRVCKPGGLVALANWTPEGQIGELFEIMGKYMPAPPSYASSPPNWGDEEYVRALFADALDLEFERTTVQLDYESADHYVAFMETNYGPTLKARERLTGDGTWHDCRRELVEMMERRNEAADGTLRVPAEYLIVLGRKR
jgi:2-polyprenyl-6-hydroxyphenyl methylase/3-demethylubiquinone-9 3-methyltransferase